MSLWCLYIEGYGRVVFGCTSCKQCIDSNAWLATILLFEMTQIAKKGSQFVYLWLLIMIITYREKKLFSLQIVSTKKLQHTTR